MTKCCTDAYVPEDLEMRSAPAGALGIAYLQSKKWPNGATINVKLIGASKQQHMDVERCIET